MAKIEVERGEATRTVPTVAKITLANLRALVKAPDGAQAMLVSANGSVEIDDESKVVIEWIEAKPVRSRAKKEQP